MPHKVAISLFHTISFIKRHRLSICDLKMLLIVLVLLIRLNMKIK